MPKRERRTITQKAWGFFKGELLVREEDGSITLFTDKGKALQAKEPGEELGRVWIKRRKQLPA